MKKNFIVISLAGGMLSSSMLGAYGSVIPCPGIDDPTTFNDIPLSERPNLEKILQHGYHPGLMVAALPSQDSFPLIQMHTGFVSRPFRMLSDDACKLPFQAEDAAISCFRNNVASVNSRGPGGSFAYKQIHLQYGLSWDSMPHTGSMLNPTYHTWADEVLSFWAEHEGTCQDDSSNWSRSLAYSCSVAKFDCQVIDPEFEADLSNLAIESIDQDPQLFQAYQNFVDKWGYGAVDRFALGRVQWSLTLLSLLGNEPPYPRLNMGRAGGMADLATGRSFYTEDDCLDPPPVDVRLKPWDIILEDFYEYAIFKNQTIPTENLAAIVANFYLLRTSYSLPEKQIDEEGLSYANCPSLFYASQEPSLSPTNAPTTHATSNETPQASLVPTSSIDQPSTLFSPTSVPTLEGTPVPTLEKRDRSSHDSGYMPYIGFTALVVVISCLL